MFHNYIKIAIRNIIKHKTYSLINIIGLGTGLAACLLIVLFINWERSFDTMHPDGDRIYRVLTIDKAIGTNNQRVGITAPMMGPTLPNAFPDIESTVRVAFGGQSLLTFGDRPGIYAQQMTLVDTTFFDFFNFPLLEGDPQRALAEPFSIILTESLARQIFGDSPAMGQTIHTDSGNDLRVTGILQDLPPNTLFQFDALGPLSTMESIQKANQPPDSNQPIFLENWQVVAMPTFVKFKPGVSAAPHAAKFTQHWRDNGISNNFEITLQPLADVHLKSTDIIFDAVTNKGDIKNVYTFSIIALLILLIASVNYMNLATARSTQRAKEVGIRKVIGSQRRQLIVQFLGESVLITLCAFLIAIPIVDLALPWLNNLTGAAMSINFFTQPLIGLVVIVFLIGVGLLAGFYPALILTSFQPISVLKGSLKSGKGGTRLRTVLVVTQFTLSIALIVVTIIVQQQIHYIQQKDLGYNREQVLLLDIFSQSMGAQLETLRQELLAHSGIVAAATTSTIPGRQFGRTGVNPQGVSDEEIWIWSQYFVSPETIPTLDMEMVQGRNFNREMGTDTTNVAIINETALGLLGWDNPLDKLIYFGEQDTIGSRVIGVVKDFHFAGLQQNIEPVVLRPMHPFPGNLIAARIQADQVATVLPFVEKTWKKFFPGHPFEYSFMDEEFENQYRREVNTGKIVNVFSVLTILVACLGLFGLAGFAITQRTREIGVRKVLGATTPTILKLLIIDFIKWVVLANLFAWPIAWYGSQRWLEGFAYRIEVHWLPFVLAGTIALIIAILTVSGQAFRAARANPVKALRYE